jgi:CBS domain-containing protein
MQSVNWIGNLAGNLGAIFICYLLMHCCKHELDEGYMKALDLMSVDIIAATENVSAIEVATRIVLGAINGMPIISKDDGKLLGVVTTIDLLRAIRTGGDLTTIIAKEIMSPGPFSVKEDTDVSDIIDIMDKKGIMMLPVVQNDGRLIGVCSRSDVLKEILNERFVTIGMKRTATRTIGEGA